jgi:hypothetical protein
MAWCDGGTLGIHHIYPAGAIGLGSDPKLLEVSRNMIEAMARWHDDKNGFSSWYPACARVGYDPKTILARLRTETDNRSYPNLLVNYDDDGGASIENVSGFLAVNEMLFQSHDGVLRFFPCWPHDMPARFGTLRAVGAFLVSGEFRDGAVRKATIQSEKGRPCRVKNPWPGKALRVTDAATGGEVAATPDPNRPDRLVFQTQPGHAYELHPFSR